MIKFMRNKLYRYKSMDNISLVFIDKLIIIFETHSTGWKIVKYLNGKLERSKTL